MKKQTPILLILLLCTPFIYAQDILDITFNQTGIATYDFDLYSDVANAVAIQPDGKIIVAGRTSVEDSNHFCLLRYNTDGSLDSTFGEAGVSNTIFEHRATIFAIEILDNNNIVVAGNTWTDQNVFVVAQYLPNGNLDTSFGNNGTTLSTIGYGGVAFAMAIQNDGKIVVGGTTQGIFGWEDYAFGLIRYTSTGEIDTTFGDEGRVVTDVIPGSGLSTIDEIKSLAITDNGDIVAAGVAGGQLGLAKYNSSGQLDTSFGNQGTIITLPNNTGLGQINKVLITPKTDILAGGFSTNDFSNFTLVQFTNDGILDPNFGDNGYVITSLSNEQDYISDILLLANGDILAAGSIKKNSQQFGIARYLKNGTLDTNYGTDGILYTPISDAEVSHISAIALHDNGNLVATGYAQKEGNDFIATTRYTEYMVQNHTPISTLVTHQIYPNPSTDNTLLSLELLTAETISIQLLTPQGQTIQTIVNQELYHKGKYDINIDLATLPQGNYYIETAINTQRQLLPIVKM